MAASSSYTVHSPRALDHQAHPDAKSRVDRVKGYLVSSWHEAQGCMEATCAHGVAPKLVRTLSVRAPAKPCTDTRTQCLCQKCCDSLKAQLGSASWGQQLRDSLYVGGSAEEQSEATHTVTTRSHLVPLNLACSQGGHAVALLLCFGVVLHKTFVFLCVNFYHGPCRSHFGSSRIPGELWD
eukprot:4764657-Amphidinium_carterae.1